MVPNLSGAIILSGGQGSRLGGCSKAEIAFADGTMLERVAEALRAYTDRIVLVARPDLQPEAERLGLIRTMEEPAGGGPAAGIQAGMECLEVLRAEHAAASEGDVAVFAIDTPGIATLLPALLAERECFPEPDAVLPLADFPQYLQGVYRYDALRAVFAQENAHGRSVKSFMKHLEIHTVAVAAGVSRDLDTPDDLHFWRGNERTRCGHEFRMGAIGKADVSRVHH